MRTMRFSVCAAVGAIAMLLSSCQMNAADQVRVKAAETFKCARASVQVVEVEKPSEDVTVYEAKGCGETTRYACELVDEASAARDLNGGIGSMSRVM